MSPFVPPPPPVAKRVVLLVRSPTTPVFPLCRVRRLRRLRRAFLGCSRKRTRAAHFSASSSFVVEDDDDVNDVKGKETNQKRAGLQKQFVVVPFRPDFNATADWRKRSEWNLCPLFRALATTTRTTTRALGMVVAIGAWCTMGGALPASAREKQHAGSSSVRESRGGNSTDDAFVFRRKIRRGGHKKSRAKRNSFVRKAAESVGPCVVRVDALMPSPSSTRSRENNTQQKERTEEQLQEDEGQTNAADAEDPLRKAKSGDDAKKIRKKKNERNESMNGDTRYDEWHEGGGCGLVLDATLGRVVTNAHVVGDAQKVRVTFTDGRTYIADVKGVDQTADIALLKLNLRPSHVLPRCDIGDSDEVDVGDWAVAVGNPFGLDNSVALGIISNLARTSTELGIPERRSVEFFQTDCAINPGNSGGPLVNEFSEVIAINAAIRRDADGIGFAIPINTVRQVAEAISRGEIIARPYLGIEMATLLEGEKSPSSSSASSSSPVSSDASATDTTTKNPPREGALIVKVSNASPAKLAGVRVGDVIIDCNGEAIVDANQVRQIAREADPGKVLSIVVWRVDTFTLETLEVIVGDASLGRVSTAVNDANTANDDSNATQAYTNNNNNNNNKGTSLVIAPPGMGGVQRRAR